MALAAKVATLQLELEDRTKTAELLTKLLSDQAKRNEEERTSLHGEHTVAYEQLLDDCKRKEKELADSTDELQRKKRHLEQKIKDLAMERKASELRKKSNTENLRQQIQSKKEEAHAKFQADKANCEKLWHVRRTQEIAEMTWNSVQPNIERLNRKHRERCEDLQSQTEFTRHKLEAHAEIELADKVQAFRADMERRNSEGERVDGISENLSRKTIEHRAELKSLREALELEEKSTGDLHALEVETLLQENKAELVSLEAPNVVERFARELECETTNKAKELATRVESIRGELEKAKVTFEADWRKKAGERMEKKMQKYCEELTAWRNCEIDSLLRQSVIDEENYPPAQDDSGAMQEEETMTERLRSRLERNGILKCKVVALEKKYARSKEDLAAAEEILCEATSHVTNQLGQLARKEKKHHLVKEDIVRRTRETIDSIIHKRLDIETEIAEVKKKQAAEEASRQTLLDSLRAEHEKRLGALHVRASERLETYGCNMRQVQATAREQRAVLDQAKILLDSRYGPTPS